MSSIVGVQPGSGLVTDPAASAVYNMALAGTVVNTSSLLAGIEASVLCDKLRLTVVAPPSRAPEQWFPEPDNFLGGGVVFGPKAGRRRGVNACVVYPRVLGGRPGDHGVVHAEVKAYEDGPAYLTVEFSPSKVTDFAVRSLAEWLAAAGVRPFREWYVDRYDVAFDYVCPRKYLVIDDPHRKLDLFGVGRLGPETERTGFRRGSEFKCQLYDKGAERASKGYLGESVGVTRYEVQISTRSAGRQNPPRLGDLPGLRFPDTGVVLRCFPFGLTPLSLSLEALLTLVARYLGMRVARAFAHEHLGKVRREAWEACMVSEVSPSPAELYRAGWSAAAGRVLSSLAA